MLCVCVREMYGNEWCVCVFLQGVTIVKPIVFGNVARYFGKKREEDGHTHQWTVYVKPYRNEVMSVTTLLHSTRVGGCEW